MKYKLPLSALFLSLLCLAAAPSTPDKPVVKHVVNKAVSVCDVNEEVGSGVIVSHAGKTYCLTCAHVAEEFEKRETFLEDPGEGNHGDAEAIVEQLVRKKVTLKPYRGAKGEAINAWVDRKRDVALMEVLGGLKHIDPVKIDPRACVEPDDDVYYCGCGVKPFNLQRTWVAALLPKEGALALGIGGWYGHSGSGVFKKDGWKLVGLVQGAWEPAGRLVRAVDLKSILASLKDYDDHAAIEERTKAR